MVLPKRALPLRAIRRHVTPYLFLLPAIVLLVIFRYIPILSGLRESFYSNGLSLSGGQQFVGLANFARLFREDVFARALSNTVLFSLVVNPLQTGLALLLALLANQKLRGIAAFRTIYLIPVALSMTVTALALGLALDRNYGMVNGLLVTLGLPRQPFLGSPDQALWTIVAIVTWVGVPYWTIFFLAGLQNIPAQLHEAAQIDGATALQRFWHVTLPLLRRTTAFVLITDTIINFSLFAPIQLLTRGGPELSTTMVMYEAYRRGFVYGDLGVAAALATCLLLVVLAIVALQLFLLRPKD